VQSHFFLCSRAALVGLGAVLMVGLSACNEMASADSAKLQLSDISHSTPILVEPVHGAAPEFAARIAADVAEDLRAHGVAAVTAQPKQNYHVLRGKVFRQDSVGGLEDVLAYWELIDASGRRIGTFAQNVEAPVGSWQKNDANLAKNLSIASAPQLSDLILGNNSSEKTALKAGGISPQIASLDETVTSPLVKFSSAVTKLPPPARAETKLAVADTVPDGNIHLGAPIQVAQAKLTKGGPTMAVLPVTGAPSDGNGQILKALMSYLEQTEIKLVNRANGPDLLLKGEVEAEVLKDGSSFVTVYWSLIDRDGKILGTIKQANGVPGKTLSKSWGEIAYPVAQAGTLRIIELYQQIADQFASRRQG